MFMSLDVRSGLKNVGELGTRLLRVDGVGLLGSDYESVRVSDNGSLEIVFMSAGLGSVEERGLVRTVGFERVSGYETIWRCMGLGGVRIKSSSVGEVCGGGNFVRSVDDISSLTGEVELAGVEYWISGNDSGRERIEWLGGTWGLKSGGALEDTGYVVGGEGLRFKTRGELLIGEERVLIGGDFFRVFGDRESGQLYLDSVEAWGAILDSGDLIGWGSLSVGFEGVGIGYVGVDLGVGVGLVSSGVVLSPIPHLNEYPLLRRVGEGGCYWEVVDWEEGMSLEGRECEVLLDRATGRVYFGGGVDLVYEGLSLSGGAVGMELETELAGGFIGEGSYGVSGWVVCKDGSGVEGSYSRRFLTEALGSYVRLSSGEVLGVSYVSSLPVASKRKRGIAYVVSVEGGSFGLVGIRSGSLEGAKFGSGLVWFSRGGSLRGLVSSIALRGSGSLVVGGEDFVWENGEVVGSVPAGVVIDAYGYVRVLGELVSGDLESLSLLGMVPHEEYAGGVCLSVNDFAVGGFAEYDEEEVGEVKRGMALSLLAGLGEVDTARGYGYGEGKHFRVGDKILERGVDLEYDLDMAKSVTWVQGVSLRGVVRGVVRSLSLSVGVYRVESFVLDGVELLEGVDFEVGYGSGGLVTFKRELMAEVGEGLLEDLDKAEGDWIVGLDGYWRRVLSGGLLSSEEYFESGGLCKEYKGYREGEVGEETPDQSKLLGECWSDLPRRSCVEVYKIYGLDSFESVSPSSGLYLRSGEVYYPIYVLLREELITGVVTDEMVRGGDYVLEIEGVEYVEGVEIEGKKFMRGEGGLISYYADGALDSSWVRSSVVYYRGIPSDGLVDRAECSSVGLSDLKSPFGDGSALEVMELLSGVSYEASTGAVSFSDPLREGLGLEISYVAEDVGERVMEQMLFNVFEEEAVKIKEGEYSYMGLERGVALDVAPVVYVGAGVKTGGYRVTEDRVYVSGGAESVRISYMCTKALGGEVVVKTASSIVDYEQVTITQGSNRIVFGYDVDIGVGDLLKVGSHLFNVSGVVSARELEVSPSARFGIQTKEVQKLSVSGGYAFREVVGLVCQSNPKSAEVRIDGDLTSVFKKGCVLIMDSSPYEIDTVSLEGGVTLLKVVGYVGVHGVLNSVYVSLRPLVLEGTKSLTAATGSVLSGNDYRLIRYASGLGMELEEGRDYRIDFESGLVELTRGVVSGESYYLKHTTSAELRERVLLGGEVEYPRYEISFMERRVPTEFEGEKIYARCWVYAPDTYHIRSVSDSVYGAEMTGELLNSLRSTQGPKISIGGNTKHGKAYGFYDLLASDVVARNQIKKHNGFIEPIDAILSSTTGLVVGDADGSFKFGLLTGDKWAGVGLEDPITREIYPRYLVTINDLSGVSEFKALRESQRGFLENEIDDIALIGYTKEVSFDLGVGFPFMKYSYAPVYAPMWKPHGESRLFPQEAKMLTYRAGGELFYERDGISTTGEVIALVENPAIGQMTNISSLTLERRPARFRVVAYSPNGFKDYAPSSYGHPSLILSAVELADFPMSGIYPNTSAFISEGGDVFDVVVGNSDRAFNGLQVGDKIMWGVEGSGFSRVVDLSNLAFGDIFAVDGTPRNATIRDVLNGCVVVLNGSSTSLSGFEGSFNPARGDTILQSFALDVDEEGSSGVYRVGTDVGLKASTGEVIDITLPSGYDPNFPIKELLGQNVPPANIALEGKVSFTYGSLEPYEYPALRGENLNDDGDQTIPFMKTRTEREILRSLPPYLERLVSQADNDGSLEYVYPDDVRDNGVIGGGGVFTTSYDYTTLAGECVQTPRVGDLMVFSDRLLELGHLDGTEMMPVRFPASNEGGYLSVVVSNALVYHLSDNDVGLAVRETLSESISGSGVYDISTVELIFSNNKGTKFFAYLDYLAGLGYFDNEIRIDVWKNGGVFRYGRFTFNRGVAGWLVTFQKYSLFPPAPVQTPKNMVSFTYSSTKITIVDNPIVSPNVPPAPAFTAESWLLDEFWGGLAGFTSTTGTTISTDVGGALWYMDFHLSYDAVSPSCYIPTDRISIRETYPIECEIQGAYSPTVEVLDSGFLVYEEGGAGTAIISSDVNNSSLINDSEAFEVKDFLSDGFLLYGFRESGEVSIDLTDTPLSIMVGSEVDEDGVIYKGDGDMGLISGGSDLFNGLIRNLTGDASKVVEGDLLVISTGHNAGLQRVKFYTEGVTDGLVAFKAGQSLAVSMSFPKVTNFSAGVLTTDSLDLSNGFDPTGEFIVLLTEGYRSRPTSTTLGVYDEAYGKSALRIAYTSISATEFNFIEAGVAYLDGTAVSFAELEVLLGSFGQTITGHKRAVFQLVHTGYVPYEVPCTISDEITFDLALAGGLTQTVSLTAITDSVGVVTALTWADLEVVSDVNDYGAAFITPLDDISFSVSVVAGIYLDKSFPRLVKDYSTPTTFGDGTSNVRSPLDYTLSNLPAYDFTERVSCVVRRPRRFTDFLTGLVEGVASFRFVYEQREGLVDSLIGAEGVYELTPALVNYLGEADAEGTHTQVGDFADVVSAGDHVMVYDADGVETMYLRITVVNEGSLTCTSVRGDVGLAHASFKIKTRNGLVPLLQSFDEFFTHGFEVLHESPAQVGISVGEEGVLTDTNVDFSALGVSVGDYLVIDPQGLLMGSEEYGYPPRGDQGFEGESGWIAGTPHELDDNRGAYPILEVGLNYLVVGESVGESQRTTYNLLPTINGVVSNPLRVTSGIVGDSYATTTNSIHPFSYRIVRAKNGLMGEGEFLFFRERTLSWAERIRAFNGLPLSLVTWEEYEANPLAGVGDYTHPSNEIILDNIKGLTGETPFVNTDTCLSVLDRRFICEDPLLVEAGYGEPEAALPTGVDEILGEMRSRENRLSWISVRTHRTKGTLPKLSTIDFSKPDLNALKDLQNG